MPNEQIAIIRNAKFGLGDRGKVVLRFDAHLTESTASLQVLDVATAVKLIEQMGITDVNQLNGKPVWMDTSNPGTSMFKRAWRA
jgi:hypothetical protein